MTTMTMIDSRRAMRDLRLKLAACALLFLLATASPALAQVLTAEDDLFYVPQAEALVVDVFGVLDNDLLDGESAGESGATAELVADVSHGTLALGEFGSFTYSPDVTFDGTDEFVYQADFGGASAQAIVSLSACTGEPDFLSCWKT